MENEVMDVKLMREELVLTENFINHVFAGEFPSISNRSIDWLIERVRFLKKTLADIDADQLHTTYKMIREN
jgi:hypothetical protein